MQDCQLSWADQKQSWSAQSAIKKVSKLKMVSHIEKVQCNVNSTQKGYTTGVTMLFLLK